MSLPDNRKPKVDWGNIMGAAFMFLCAFACVAVIVWAIIAESHDTRARIDHGRAMVLQACGPRAERDFILLNKGRDSWDQENAGRDMAQSCLVKKGRLQAPND